MKHPDAGRGQVLGIRPPARQRHARRTCCCSADFWRGPSRPHIAEAPAAADAAHRVRAGASTTSLPSCSGSRSMCCSSHGRTCACSASRRLVSRLNLPTYADVEAAARRLEGHAHRTPVLTSHGLDEALGASVFFKCENFQRMGAFKFRGAFNALSVLDEARAPEGSSRSPRAITRKRWRSLRASPGHQGHHRHAARCARLEARGDRAVTADASCTYDRYRESREEIAQRLAEESGGAVIPPYDHPDVIAGQGTAAAELIAECGPLDSLFVPPGRRGPARRLIARCPGAAPSVQGVRRRARGRQRRPTVAKARLDRAHRRAAEPSPTARRRRAWDANLRDHPPRASRTYSPRPTRSSSSACAFSPSA